MSSLLYNSVANEYKGFGFVDEIADTVFNISILANEIRLKDECRTRTFVLRPARTIYNTRIVHLTSTAVIRKIIRKRAACYNPWASAEEKRLLHEAQSLGIKMFRIRRG